ncbi:hypothetical protein ACEWJ8_24445, partial [Escherichia coli]
VSWQHHRTGRYIPRKINAGVINTPTLIRSDY